MRPFVILAWPRTGTKMIVGAVESHPEINRVIHEFRGTEQDYWEHPYVLSNTYESWMDQVLKVAIIRNPLEGARSSMMMTYQFPDNVVELPISALRRNAALRAGANAKFIYHSDYYTSYEALTQGQEVMSLPEWFSNKFCDLVGIERYPFVTSVRKTRKIILKNEDEVCALSA